MRRRRERRRTRFRRRIQLYMRLGIGILLILMVVLVGMKLLKTGPFTNEYVERTGDEIDALCPEMDVELLTVNPYSRPGTEIGRINDIVIHYTANPGSTAIQNRNYFEGLKDSKETRASSHFVVGLEGEIVQCIPTWEVAYASNERNSDTIAIETCHLSEDGAYTDETYQSMVELTAWLCVKFDLTEEDVIRHYDITEKICPKYFVEHEDAWKTFKQDVGKRLDNM
ncbi:MAG: N-acetylmuramoyl-L-alanine amidase [Tyzzerella sp.]|nr:N-acetylmuramoyl-L-alanine amidase [Tyzzerella sp.]